MSKRDFLGKYDPPVCPFGKGYNVMSRLLRQYDAEYTHTFKQIWYKSEYCGARYTNYALDYYNLTVK